VLFRLAVAASAALTALSASFTGLTAVPLREAIAGGQAGALQTCAALLRETGWPNPRTVIASASLNPAAAAQPAQNPQAPATPALPEHCEVVCDYPRQARYTGSGSVEDAGNFVCR
jgi:hypothetical protein